VTREILTDLAERAFSKSPWHSLMSALEGVSDEAFTWLPDRHNGFPWMNGSIQDIVYHVTGDKLVQLNHAFGDGSMNWENVPIAKGCSADILSAPEHAESPPYIHALYSAQEALIEAVRNCEDLNAKVTGWGGKRLKAVDFFLMLIEHDLYHAGQIRYIRNLVE
jgi:hypothetical protein